LKVKDLFDIQSGNGLNMNKMTVAEKGDADYVNFVSRSGRNQGVVERVKPVPRESYFSAGLISVGLGGSVLSSFVQQERFYTAEHMRVLTPKKTMTLQEKLYYCACIKSNAFRYSTYGREPDRTFASIDLPDTVPKWVSEAQISERARNAAVLSTDLKLTDRKWLPFRYDQLFDIERGRGVRKREVSKDGKTPFITAIDFNNGLSGMVAVPPIHQGNVITVNRNGKGVGEAFYQEVPFCSTEDVHVFNPKFTLNPFIAMFLVSLIRQERFRYSYGRKWGLGRMNETSMMLPVDHRGQPDWAFMEDYIKSLPYSKSLSA
jgi:hypothetical protein